MRKVRALSLSMLVIGLATALPSTLVAGSKTVSHRLDCNVNCGKGSCSVTGSGCHCFCNSDDQPDCSCEV